MLPLSAAFAAVANTPGAGASAPATSKTTSAFFILIFVRRSGQRVRDRSAVGAGHLRGAECEGDARVPRRGVVTGTGGECDTGHARPDSDRSQRRREQAEAGAG